MSHHASELSACGLRIDVVDYLLTGANAAGGNLKFDDVFAVFYFLRTSGSYSATAYAMSGHYKGWSVESARRKIPRCVDILCRVFGNWLDWPMEAIQHTNNSSVPFFPPDVRLVMDTVPIEMPNLDGSNCLFSGKYSEHIAKLLGVATLTGFYVFLPEYLYGGKSGDQVCMQHSGVLDGMHSRGLRCLADGGFELAADAGLVGHNDEPILIPWDGPALWADRTLTEERFAYNGKLSHVRARGEHIFARNRFGRWCAFKLKWYKSPDFLYKCVKAALIALNIELFLQHGWGGFKIHIPEFPLRSVQLMRERYPEPPPPAPPGAKKTKKKRSAKDEERQGQQSLVVMWERGRLRTQAEMEGTHVEAETSAQAETQMDGEGTQAERETPAARAARHAWVMEDFEFS